MALSSGQCDDEVVARLVPLFGRQKSLVFNSFGAVGAGGIYLFFSSRRNLLEPAKVRTAVKLAAAPKLSSKRRYGQVPLN